MPILRVEETEYAQTTGVKGCGVVVWFGKYTDVASLVLFFGFTTPAYICTSNNTQSSYFPIPPHFSSYTNSHGDVGKKTKKGKRKYKQNKKAWHCIGLFMCDIRDFEASQLNRVGRH